MGRYVGKTDTGQMATIVVPDLPVCSSEQARQNYDNIFYWRRVVEHYFGKIVKATTRYTGGVKTDYVTYLNTEGKTQEVTINEQEYDELLAKYLKEVNKDGQEQ